MVARQADHGAVGDAHAEQRAAAALVGTDDQRLAVGGPAHVVRPAVPIRRDDRDLAPGDGHDGEVDLRRAIVGGAQVAEDRDGAPVGRDPRTEVVVGRVVGQRGALRGGDVDRHDDLAVVAVGVVDVPRDHGGATVGGELGVGLQERVAGRRRLVRPGHRVVAVGDRAGEQARLVGPEVVVPVADRVAGVQDRGDLAVLARLAALLVVLAGHRAGQRRREHRDRVRRRGRRDALEAARARADDAGLAAALRQQPQGRGRVVVGLLGVGVRARGEEEQVAAGGERHGALALAAARQAAGGGLAGGVDLPHRADEPGALRGSAWRRR